jgi:hypothetical protein
MESLARELGGPGTRQLAQALGGADERRVGDAISGALPLLLGALAKNSSNSPGASALLAALDRDHDGSILDDLAGFIGRGDAQPGAAILGHVLGGSQRNAAAAISQTSGLDSGQAARLLSMLAPIVLGALGRQQRRQGLDAAALADALNREQAQVGSVAPDAMRVFGRLLDQDGDGDIKDDLARAGTGLLGQLFRK